MRHVTWSVSKFLSVLCIISVTAINARAANYYIKLSGNDSLAGTTPVTAWRTLNKLNSVHLHAGDSVLLHGGDTLAGNIYLSPSDSGTPAHPVVFSSYGGMRATINADKSFAFYVYNAGGIVIRNMNMYGAGMSVNTSCGIFLYTDNYAPHPLAYLQIDSLQIQGFQNGISMGSWDTASYTGFRDVRITHVDASYNGSGISSYDAAGQNSRLYAHKNVYVGYCTTSYNGVNGIVLGGVDSGTIEYCRASYTGAATNKGSVGIWVWSARNLVIQHCISDHTITTGGDGDGFDLDGGADHCIVQYCYSYNNDGCGYMHCDYPYSRPTRKNIIRYNVSENDGRKINRGGTSFLFNSWGSGLDSCDIYNNDAYMSDNDSSLVAALGGYMEYGYDSASHISHCFARNNIFYLTGVYNNAFVSFSTGRTPIADTNILLQGNNYYTSNTKAHQWLNESATVNNLADWQATMHQEMWKGAPAGDTLDPLLQNAGKGGAMLSTDSLKYLDAYMLKTGSPMIDAGLNLDSVGCDIGSADFYGNNPKQGKSQDIGMYASTPRLATAQVNASAGGTIVYPNPAHNSITIVNPAMVNDVAIVLYDVYGRQQLSAHCATAACLLDISALAPGTYLLQIKRAAVTEMKKVIKE